MTGTFTVPTPSGYGAASIWVGIDGDTCGSAILQTGIDVYSENGEIGFDGTWHFCFSHDFSHVDFSRFSAWYEWFPDYAYYFSDIDIEAGDVITVTVTATSTTSGSATITNQSRDQTVVQQLSSTSALCESNAEWIVEDFSTSSGLVPFADFGTVTSTNALATTPNGNVGPGGASDIDIVQNNEILTSVSIGSQTVTVSYV